MDRRSLLTVGSHEHGAGRGRGQSAGRRTGRGKGRGDAPRPGGLAARVGQWALVHWPAITPRGLRRLGLNPASVAAACEIRCVRTESELRQVLALRQLTYALAGKVDPRAAAIERQDRWDAEAQIIAAFHRGCAVGSVRVNIPSGAEPHEFELLAPIPPPYDNRAEVGVVSRVCTHPHYRGSDLLKGLIEAAHEVMRAAGRRYGVGGCTLGLIPVYGRFGWKPLPVAYSQAAYGGYPEQLIVRDLGERHPFG